MLEFDSGRTKDGFAAALQHYLGATLHARVDIAPFDNAASLPLFLARSYTLHETSIAGRRVILVATEKAAGTPSDIAKHIALVRSAVRDAVVVFVTPSLSAHHRSRLLSQGVAFIVPGNQLYIPELAMDLREHFRAPKPQTVDGLTPAAQAVLFLHLLHRDEGATTPSMIAKRLRYSAMSIGRAFDDLAAAGLADTEKRGKERHLRFRKEGRALLEEAQALLRSPVRAVKYIGSGPIGPTLKRAGEAALAELSDLSMPRIETWAVAASDWKAVAVAENLVETDECEAAFIIETWSYDPAGLSDDAKVDPLSLYAQFKDHRDERVAMAAEQLLEKVPF
ncbi:MAG: hypothetical protein Tsb0016_26550 [Sphingomonadales bacterium]